MLGAIIGDVVGSRFEFHNVKTKEFTLFSKKTTFTDDTVMTIAVMDAILSWNKKDYEQLSNLAIEKMQYYGRKYENRGYGGRFIQWLYLKNPYPYNSYGNGAGMRISPVGLYANSYDECKKMTNAITSVTHNHPEGMRGANAVSSMIYLAKNGKTREEMKKFCDDYFYMIDFTIDGIRETYQHSEASQYSIPQALECFFESTDFEDCLRLSISLGGDSDTIADMACAIGEVYYGIPSGLFTKIPSIIGEEFTEITKKFYILCGKEYPVL